MHNIVNIGNTKYVLAENVYGKYYIPYDSIHRPCPKKIINNNVWEHDTLKFIDYEYSDGDIIHAGTFFGDFLPFLSKILQKKNKIFAFEPIHQNYECTKLNIDLNDIKNVELFNNCLTDRNQELKFKTFENGIFLGGGSHVTFDNVFDEKSIGIKIDNFFNQLNNCSIIQLDVEGHESKVILGAMDVISKFKPLLLLETIPNDQRVREFLNDNGYKFYFKINSNHILKSKKK